MPGAKLSDVDGSSVDVAKMMKQISKMGPQERRSKVTSLNHFLKSNQDQNANNAPGSAKGPELDKLLCKFMMHAAKCKDMDTSMNIAHTTSSSRKNEGVDHEWSREQMDKEMGANRGKLLRDSNKLVWHKCPITDSDHEDLRIWVVPEKWVAWSQGDDKSITTASSGACTQEEYEALHTGCTYAADGKELKVEPPKVKTAAETVAEELKEFQENLQQIFKKMQDVELEATLIQATAKTKRKDSEALFFLEIYCF